MYGQQQKIEIKKTFKPLTWQIAPFKSKAPVVLLTGSAGGGKSHIAYEKINAYALKYPGSFCLILRKNRVSLTSGGVLFFEQEVIVNRSDDPEYGVRHIESKSRFEYANGSIVAYSGIADARDREKLKSIGTRGGVDICLMEEATEFVEQDFNTVQSRMRGRAGAFRQIILATNPDSPTHWIYSRLIMGKEAEVHLSSAQDNTHNPSEYLKTLARMTGVEQLRLAKGMWTEATGVVYDTWLDCYPGHKPHLDENGEDTGILDWGNVTELAEYVAGDGPVFWAIDDGYSSGKKFPNGIDPNTQTFTGDAHPRTFGLFQLKSDGHIDLFYTSYACKKMSDIHIREVFELDYPIPEFVAIDSSAAELRGRFAQPDAYHDEKGYEKLRPALYVRKATHRVEEGIKVLRKMITATEAGVRVFRVHPRCGHIRKEMVSYVWNENTNKPQKEFDHGPDMARYLAWQLRYEI